jgi:rare lipoprotein A (peptidoglycan hydrolase)
LRRWKGVVKVVHYLGFCFLRHSPRSAKVAVIGLTVCWLSAASSPIFIFISPAHAYTDSDWNNDAEVAFRTIDEPASNDQFILGLASWYGNEFAGKKTSTGESFDPNHLTAASRQLPLKSKAMVTNLDNGRSVQVRINDCGPYVKGRKLDLSKRAAQKLAMIHKGIAPVKIKLVKKPRDAAYCGTPSSTNSGRVNTANPNGAPFRY